MRCKNHRFQFQEPPVLAPKTVGSCLSFQRFLSQETAVLEISCGRMMRQYMKFKDKKSAHTKRKS